ncbi:Probable bifunctional protein : 2-amino-4-hydroxy-6-hydroxymethyldihydropteridine diphosphokinase and deoxynucleoside kinase [Flavobacterium indicum GPTSA100-9 = DSM 17447]|uniref:2-amino-4-hydroxy-6-hydroxymethyldihydropteridine pyrophosphokinase n=1 Tax=Flavobacterium indicum (strain DSM 17447 / CIP 109464 / GPTSA100-9) TaxID=1094466 RepID=H8XR85_FLAIG|nr:2-amino-4-hydroxy-6-hydroxymethyldihydropteridine diphosphokinase [Flavobacterium indicum]CCG54319.1 Probable bifunctional protein : 2-amino-4-hydroxy-6-hydroxymethyldihydropteridine diphosphokinase and deoxynucleoside kinase [Flavobacterium indicum GPTSA100-9 = DSM 17447]
MKNQNTALLSLGTNLGDRLKNLQFCIDAIHEEVATVVQVSPVYETPAWGFEAAPFYNCMIQIHTLKSATKILSKILKLEKKLGRTRSEKSGYQSRIIDIDIIAFNDELIETENLIVPHPRLEMRNFVLYPLKDIAGKWVHPKTKELISDLIQNSTDSSAIERVAHLINPIQKIKNLELNYIAIEGNIGAGKTTLASKIAEDCNAKLVLERFADNPFLPKFYKDQSRYAFPLEMSFLADRYQQLTDDLAQFDLFKDFIVADYHIFKSLIFAKVTLQEDEYRLYKNLFDIIYKEMPKPDLYVYLYQNTERLLANIKKRGRSYEQEIPADYLEKINQGYLDYIKTQTDLNILIIDVSDLDFVKKQEDYVFILNAIKKKIEN